MAYVHGYDYDIFISYTHDDNYAFGDEPGWIDQFHEWLEAWLVRRRGLSDLAIWRDRELAGNTEFNVAIENKIRSSALFFVLHSRNYPKSEYCRKELEWFHQYASSRPGGLMVGERLCVFNVLLNNMPYREWPKALGETSGFPMHDAKEDDQLGEFTSPSSDSFEKQLRPIVDAVEATLAGFPSAPPEPAPAPSHSGGTKIFMADVADTLQVFRDRLVTEIEHCDASVLDDIPPPMEMDPHQQAVVQALGSADLSIHLLDQWPGRRIVDQRDTTYTRQQADSAVQVETPSILWVPDDLASKDINDDTQREWLTALEDRTGQQGSYEFVRCNQHALIELVVQRIVQGRSVSASQPDASSYLIDTHQRDQRYAYRLADFLAENGVDVDFNKESRDPVESLNNFENAVKRVHHLVIMCGKVAPDWLQARIQRAVKIVAEQFGSESPSALQSIWVYFAPESPGPEALPRLPPLLQLKVLDNRDSETVDPSVAMKLLRGGA